MDNASKAVIMAGSVLIAVSLISLALYAYSSYKDYADTSERLLSLSQIESFNRYYESFDEGTDTIRGIDALNIYKKAKDDGLNPSSAGLNTNLVNGTDLETQSQHFFERYNYHIGYDTFGKVNSVSFN